MNREPKSRKTGEFQSTNEAQTTGKNLAFDRWTAFPGVGFFAAKIPLE